jgi:hypothetical protein
MKNIIEANGAIDEPGTTISLPRVCEACGQPFVCGASLKDCWCSQIEFSAEVKTRMRERYRDCLCSECLTRFAVNED